MTIDWVAVVNHAAEIEGQRNEVRRILLENSGFDDPHTGDAGRVAAIATAVGLHVEENEHGDFVRIVEP